MSRGYSVVIAAYNAELTIEACLRSVIQQTLPPLQVLVIDDDSTDGTAAKVLGCAAEFAAAGIGLECLRLSPNAGPAAARNRGIREAQGEFIAFLDADDCWSADKLAIVDGFARDGGAGLLCHGYTASDELSTGLRRPDFAASTVPLYGLLVRNPAQPSCTVVRKTPDLAFDERMQRCEDYDLWMRIAEHSRVLRIVGAPLARLGRPQLSAGGLSGDTLGMRAGEVRVYVNFCRRKWFHRAWLLPVLVAWSALKHAYSWLRRAGRLSSER